MPECLNTTLGMQVMLRNTTCRPQLIDHLNRSFLDCTLNRDRLLVVERLSRIYSELSQSGNEKELCKTVVKWFLWKAPMFTDKQNKNRLSDVYMNALTNYLSSIQFSKWPYANRQLYRIFDQLISHTVEWKAFDQSTRLVIAFAKDDINYFCDSSVLTYKKNFPNALTNKEALKHVLDHANDVGKSAIRDKFVLALRKNALYHFETDTSFFSDFMQAAEKIMKSKI